MVVYYYCLPISKILIDYRLKCLAQEIRLVVCRDDNRDQWWVTRHGRYLTNSRWV